jgi:hypothetical protein
VSFLGKYIEYLKIRIVLEIKGVLLIAKVDRFTKEASAKLKLVETLTNRPGFLTSVYNTYNNSIIYR